MNGFSSETEEYLLSYHAYPHACRHACHRTIRSSCHRRDRAIRSQGSLYSAPHEEEVYSPSHVHTLRNQGSLYGTPHDEKEIFKPGAYTYVRPSHGPVRIDTQLGGDQVGVLVVRFATANKDIPSACGNRSCESVSPEVSRPLLVLV